MWPRKSPLLKCVIQGKPDGNAGTQSYGPYLNGWLPGCTSTSCSGLSCFTYNKETAWQPSPIRTSPLRQYSPSPTRATYARTCTCNPARTPRACDCGAARGFDASCMGTEGYETRARSGTGCTQAMKRLFLMLSSLTTADEML